MDSTSLLIFLASAVLPSLILSCLASYLVRYWAVRVGLIDRPNHRKVHSTPIPLGGGLAIWFGVVSVFALGQVALLLVDNSPRLAELVPAFAQPHLEGVERQITKLWLILAAATVLMIVGLCDDRFGLGWKIRIAVQFAVATLCVTFIDNLRLTAFIDLPWFTGALSVLWIVALVNAFNMLDNMDALSSGVAVIAATFLAAVMLLTTEPGGIGPQLFVAGLLLVLVGALLGFLWHNRPPARLFMGDAGSYFVGFLIAVSTLLATYTGYNSPSRHAVLAPLCVMAVPLYDMLTVIAIRIRAGRSPFEADKNHFSHRLVDLGFTKPRAVLTVHLLTITCGLAALLLHRVDVLGAAVVMLLVFCVLTLIAVLESTARRTLRK
jgi:UDP-GlcNAc:undecaprenyl-phosphate/decaprenyl-phosphate GlcNAc-1-phosphate transferase